MLRDAPAFPGFAVDDVPRAKEFYGTTLELEVADAPLGVAGAAVPAGRGLRLGAEARVMVYPRPDHTPATFTRRTPRASIARRRCTPVAWFRDPAGNILSIVQE